MTVTTYENSSFPGTDAIKNIAYSRIRTWGQKYDNESGDVKSVADKFFQTQQSLVNQLIPVSRLRERVSEQMQTEIRHLIALAGKLAALTGNKQHNILKNECIFSVYSGVIDEFETRHGTRIAHFERLAREGNREASNDVASVNSMKNHFITIWKNVSA